MKLAGEIRDAFKKNLVFIITADKEGIPNAAPKGSTQILDDETLMFIDVFGKKTIKNLSENPKVAAVVASMDKDKMIGYQVKGVATIIKEGELFDKGVRFCKERGFPNPNCVVTIKIEEVYSLTPGPNAGQEIR
ncbi:MAG: pyridoxamine 5'-phosphate oxidase [Deltaproteobacteria bacterium]|nr:pyridoxamine 5'-phosphate oxidase family protein [Deltaproteobacteria bacterium]RLA91740.1 MAG: pyridoxamine 5'-phosphate oxidase [Deltaproteobacteria bacterium]